MQKIHHLGILGIISWSFLVAPLWASAQTTPTRDRCPGIYYEEPWNRILAVPSQCPPNAATQVPEGAYTPPQVPTDPAIQPPQPGPAQEVIATVKPVNGRVDMRLNNTLDIPISYEVLGYTTPPRSLSGGQQVLLRDLRLPATITVIREDDGLIGIMPISSRSSLLEINLNDEPTIDRIYGVIEIERDGQVSVE
jgi:hypothetical protein